VTQQRATLFAASIAMALSIIPMFLGTFPVFLSALSHEGGWAASAFPSLLLVATVAASLSVIAAGWAVDRYGSRRIALPGIILFGGCIASLSQLDRIGIAVFPQFTLLGISGALCGPVTYAKAVSGWYEHRRGVALSIVVTAAPMLSTALMVPIVQSLIDRSGWRSAYLVLGTVIAMLGAIVLHAFFRDPPSPQDAGQRTPGPTCGVDFAGALTSSPFWILATAMAASGLIATGISAHMLSIAADVGIERSVAIWALSTMSVAALAGGLIAGFLVDRLASPRSSIACFIPTLAGVVLLRVMPHPPAFIIACALIGAGNFAAAAALPFLLSRLYGIRRLGEIFGTCSAIVATATGAGPLLFGVAHKSGIGFAGIFEIATGLLLASALLVRFIRGYPTIDSVQAPARSM
jgi:MFS family permease